MVYLCGFHLPVVVAPFWLEEALVEGLRSELRSVDCCQLELELGKFPFPLWLGWVVSKGDIRKLVGLF